MNNRFVQFIAAGNIVWQILVAIILATILVFLSPSAGENVAILGQLFVSSLKAIAPILVFVLVTAAIANHKKDSQTQLKPILVLYMLGTLSAAMVAVLFSALFPVELVLNQTTNTTGAPQGIGQVLNTLLFNVVDNPINAIGNANYIGILAWAVGLGLTLRHANETTRHVCDDLAQAVANIVKVVIRLAPLGIFGLVASTIAATGFKTLMSYSQLLMLLIAAMLMVALVVNPLLVWWKIKRNPYPLVFKCLKESGITAFFTRSSAANIPVNMNIAKNLNLHEDTYSVSIPLGATINMAGAAVTITILTLATVNTLGMQVDILTTLLLCIVASVSACGVSGVAGGSLLLIPLACSLFGISDDIAMQVVAVGFIISVLQDSAETALNSSTDILFTVAACQAENND